MTVPLSIPSEPLTGFKSDEITAEAILLWQEGFDTMEIASAVNIRESTAYRIVNIWLDERHKSGVRK